ncbi:MAG: glycoside hydrolase family 88 protein [Bacteroidales bacterium]|nr:glycoside hydrolase family 88 protein [Bacteroidales bacterium]
MSKNKQLIVLLFCLLIAITGVEAKQPYYQWMTDSEMKRMPESWMTDFAKKPKWDYCNGLELGAILDVWRITQNSKYLNYVKSYADTIISSDGNITRYKLSDYNIDKLNSGKMLFDLYDITKEKKLKKAIDLLRSQMITHPRTSEGGFWHKKIYPNQMWLDGLYMGSPFLAEYAHRYGGDDIFDDVAKQIILIHKHLYDEKTGLYYHGWDESREQKWADSQTGCSPNFWSRSMGWYMMALVDVLDFLPKDHIKRPEIIKILTDLCKSIEKYRDPKTGMWYQVTDKVGEEGNYVESSGSAMFIYTWVKGGQKGYLPKSFLKKGTKAYNQFVKRFIHKNIDGTISLTDACSVAGLGGEPKYRDGSYQYYITEPIRENDPKAVGPFIMVSTLLKK